MSEIINKIFRSEAGKLIYHKIVGRNKELIILYIHGLAPASSIYTRSFAEQHHQFDLFEYSFLIPHLIGFGDSEKPDNLDIYTAENQGQYLYDLLLSENIRNVIIMAISMGGPVAISLINKIKNQADVRIKVKGLFYLEGNLDKNDTFFSSTIAKYPFEQFREQFDSWIDNLIERTQSKNVEFFEKVSESNQLLPHLQQLMDFPVYFVFGENNRGRYTSEDLVKSAKLPVIYIPDAGHAMRTDNPEGFWKVVKELLKFCR
jgi:pimeloyl-ACP methyl ester carboxylesterase